MRSWLQDTCSLFQERTLHPSFFLCNGGFLFPGTQALQSPFYGGLSCADIRRNGYMASFYPSVNTPMMLKWNLHYSEHVLCHGSLRRFFDTSALSWVGEKRIKACEYAVGVS